MARPKPPRIRYRNVRLEQRVTQTRPSTATASRDQPASVHSSNSSTGQSSDR